jgi:hypothetical protein
VRQFSAWSFKPKPKTPDRFPSGMVIGFFRNHWSPSAESPAEADQVSGGLLAQ